MNQKLTVLYFAWLRERVGTAEETIDLPAPLPVSDLIGILAARSAGHAAAFENRRTIRCAINQEFADPSALVNAGDEIAFFPPVTGG
jgi:molybdopterin converting factor subunit 1